MTAAGSIYRREDCWPGSQSGRMGRTRKEPGQEPAQRLCGFAARPVRRLGNRPRFGSRQGQGLDRAQAQTSRCAQMVDDYLTTSVRRGPRKGRAYNKYLSGKIFLFLNHSEPFDGYERESDLRSASS